MSMPSIAGWSIVLVSTLAVFNCLHGGTTTIYMLVQMREMTSFFQSTLHSSLHYGKLLIINIMTAYMYSDPIPLILMSDIQGMQTRIESHGARVGIELGFPVHLGVAEQDQTKAPPPPLDHIWASDAYDEEDGEKPSWIALPLLDSQMRSSSQSLWIELPPDLIDSTSPLDTLAESWKDAVMVPETGLLSDEKKSGANQNIAAPANEVNVATPEPPSPTSSKVKILTRLLSKPLPPLPLDTRLSASSVGSRNTFYYLRQREQMKDFFAGRFTYTPPIHPLGTPLPTGPANPRSCPANHQSGRIPSNINDHRRGQIHHVTNFRQGFAFRTSCDWISAIGRVFSFRQEPPKKMRGHPGPFETFHADGKCMQKGCSNWQRKLIKKCGRCDLLLCDDCVRDKDCPGKRKQKK
jgi:hypothetical protein